MKHILPFSLKINIWRVKYINPFKLLVFNFIIVTVCVFCESILLSFLFSYFKHLFMPCSCESVHLCQGSVWKKQDSLWDWFSSFSMWVLGTEPMSSGLETVVLLLSHLYNLFFFFLMHSVLFTFCLLVTFQGDCLRGRLPQVLFAVLCDVGCLFLRVRHWKDEKLLVEGCSHHASWAAF